MQTTIKWRPRSEPVREELDGFYTTYLIVRGSGLIGSEHDKGDRPVITNFSYCRDPQTKRGFFPDWVSEFALPEDITTTDNQNSAPIGAKEKAMEFKLGDKVQWSSGAGGGWTKKTGVIVRVVGVGKRAVMDTYKHKAKSAYGGGMTRNHVSYVVLVPGKTVKASPTLYWPRASALELAA